MDSRPSRFRPLSLDWTRSLGLSRSLPHPRPVLSLARSPVRALSPTASSRPVPPRSPLPLVHPLESVLFALRSDPRFIETILVFSSYPSPLPHRESAFSRFFRHLSSTGWWNSNRFEKRLTGAAYAIGTAFSSADSSEFRVGDSKFPRLVNSFALFS